MLVGDWERNEQEENDYNSGPGSLGRNTWHRLQDTVWLNAGPH